MTIQDGKNPPSPPGSDLDVFDDLQKKSSPSVGRPRTMIGMPPAPAPKLPPPPPLSPAARSTVPPPSVGRGAAHPTMPTARSMPPAPPPPPPLATQRSSVPPAGLPPAGGITARPPARALPEVSSDWDDEQEKTTVYDRSTQDAASALLRGGPADIPPPPMSRPPAAMPMPARPAAPQAAAFAATMAAAPVRYPAPPSRAPLYMMAAAVIVLGAVLGLLLRPAKGSLIVTVAGAGSRPIDAVEVLVDDEVVCTDSPCRVPDLKAGTYFVQARAAGHMEAAKIAIVITGGQEAVHNVTLARSGGTGIKVSAQGTGLKLFVDGSEIGPLPQELNDMAPGDHLIRVAGNDRYAPYEQRITVQAGNLETIGPLSLRVVKGLATIQAGEGVSEARVTLESGSDRRTLPELPIRIDIPTDRENTLVAVRRGYATYREKLLFEDGQAEKTFVITLTKIGENTPTSTTPSAPSPGPGPGPSAPTPTPSEPAATEKPSASAPTGSGTLNINSIPRSTVLLDGRPIGQTPRIGITVSAGTHTVVFVKDGERKTATVSVPDGGNKTVAVRF